MVAFKGLGKPKGPGVELHQMDIDQGVDEQTAPQIGGVASDLPAVEAEDAVDGVIVEVGVDEAAKSPKDEDVVFREQIPLAEVDARLEVDRLEVAVEVVLVIAAIGRDALASRRG